MVKELIWNPPPKNPIKFFKKHICETFSCSLFEERRKFDLSLWDPSSSLLHIQHRHTLTRTVFYRQEAGISHLRPLVLAFPPR